jgi:hypothetical protein
MVRCHVAKKREFLCVCCVVVQPDALAHSGAHSGAHSSSDALTHTSTDGDALHGDALHGDALHGDALHSGPKHGNAEYGARELRQFRHVRHE